MTYDSIGNLTSYAGWTYTWAEGRRLVKQVQDSKTVTYAYDASGLRVKKTYNSTVYDYTWSGSKLVHLKVGNNHLHFFYDDAGSPSMMLYNGVPYRYVKNLQGDIIAIVDTSGTTVVEYKYDPWGKKESRTGSLSGTVGYYNPFRYRGYIFDEETWMYYLKDRYYYPELRRFISADRKMGVKQKKLSLNLFLYCLNNSITLYDPDGTNGVYFAKAPQISDEAQIAMDALGFEPPADIHFVKEKKTDFGFEIVYSKYVFKNTNTSLIQNVYRIGVVEDNGRTQTLDSFINDFFDAFDQSIKAYGPTLAPVIAFVEALSIMNTIRNFINSLVPGYGTNYYNNDSYTLSITYNKHGQITNQRIDPLNPWNSK